jgi:heat shock protein HslJ
VTLPGVPVPEPSAIDSPRNGPPTIEFSQSRAAGFSGVNRFAADFTLNATGPGGLRFGPIISTKMAGPADRMALEAAFVKALADTSTARIEGDDLILLTNQTEILRLRRQP